MALPKEKQQTIDDLKSHLAALQSVRRSSVVVLRRDAREKLSVFVAREYAKGFSLDQIGDHFLKIAKVSRCAEPFVDEARSILVLLGWKPKRERA